MNISPYAKKLAKPAMLVRVKGKLYYEQ